MCVCAHGNTECSGETKVGQLDVTGDIYEEILWLEVAVEDAMGMTVRNALKQLVEVTLQQQHREGVCSETLSHLELSVSFCRFNCWQYMMSLT